MHFRKTFLAGIPFFTASVAAANAVASTILVFAPDQTTSYSATSGLNAYGIPYQLVLVPQAGVTLPTLNSTASQGNYGGFIVLSEVSYDYSGDWHSALTTAQWQQLFDYQTAFGVRMVRLDAYPQDEFGVTTYTDGQGCCNDGVEQLVSFSNTAAFPLAGLKTGAGVSTQGLYHYPAKITNKMIAAEIAQFAASSDKSFTKVTTAGIINTFGKRQQMVFFINWSTDWSSTSNFLQHGYIWWLTRGLFAGIRRTYLNTQVDDMHLTTDLYSPAGSTYRVNTNDLAAHITWQTSIRSRLPSGSNYTIEIGHNGNGDIIAATNADTKSVCNPSDAIYQSDYTTPPLEFQKPLGTGTNYWPSTPKNYTWSSACAKLDKLATWFSTAANRDAFMHMSHTFSHENMNNATYSDAYKEINFNVAWLNQIGLSAGKWFSPNGLIPPAITGLHNGDALRAWMDQGIKYVVGDNSRPLLLNNDNEHWPLISTVPANGYAGMTIVPRFVGPIYYDCDKSACTTQEWIDTSGGSGSFSNLLAYIKDSQIRNYMSLRHDPQMFHQANMRAADIASSTIGSQKGKFSLLMAWVETVFQEYTRLVTWPVLTLKHDDLGVLFTNRMTRDKCGYNAAFNYSADGKTIQGVTVSSSSGNKCAAQIPVTVPVAASQISTTAPSGSWSTEQIGSDPVTVWVTLSGSPVTISFATPVTL